MFGQSQSLVISPNAADKLTGKGPNWQRALRAVHGKSGTSGWKQDVSGKLWFIYFDYFDVGRCPQTHGELTGCELLRYESVSDERRGRENLILKRNSFRKIENVNSNENRNGFRKVS